MRPDANQLLAVCRCPPANRILTRVRSTPSRDTTRGEQVHVGSVWHYALSEGKKHGSDATFDAFEDNKHHMNAPAPTGPLLRRKFAVLTSTVVETQRSEDGTVKLLVRFRCR